LKNYFYFLLIFTLFTACKPTSAIITSKEIAIKKGVYKTPDLTKSEVIKDEITKEESTKSVVKKENKSKTVKQKNEAPKVEEKISLINNKNDDDIIIDSESSNYLIEQLINFASDNLGINYRGGGTSKEGFDCSGLMYCTFKNFDIELPRSSYEMARIGHKIELNEVKKGDLIFFKTTGRRNRISHVGMVVETNNSEVKFIHSSTSSGVIISSTSEPYYQKTFTQANRVLN
jgi:murein DD-endopeptidase / murein LD-carboxypeptidase